MIGQVQARATAIENQLGRSPRIGCLGMAFKPMLMTFESPAPYITTELLLAGLDVLACEPNLSDHPTIALSPEQVLSTADFSSSWWPTARSRA